MVTDIDREISRFEDFFEMEEGIGFDDATLNDLKRRLSEWLDDFGSGEPAGMTQNTRQELADSIMDGIAAQGLLSEETEEEHAEDGVGRHAARKKKWSRQDIEKLRELYGRELTIRQIIARLPATRSPSAIYHKASRLGIRRTRVLREKIAEVT